MSEVKADQRRAARQKEAVLMLEERAQEILLQGSELMLTQSSVAFASDQTGTPRRRGGGPALASTLTHGLDRNQDVAEPTSAAKPLPAK